MNVELLVPDMVSLPVEQVAERASRSGAARPFAPERMELCVAFSAALFGDAEAKRYSELQALAFWMRKAEVHRLAQAFAALEDEGVLLVPRGVVFHIPPANVDTMFVYSWLLAFLTGNINIVRLSSRQTPQTRAIIRLLNAILHERDSPDGTIMLTYAHDAEITARLSAACDVRVVWGGDATVQAVRAAPLPPHARELTFADRFSFAVLGTEAYLQLAEPGRRSLAERFFNDTYWFDQLGCSSARLVVWVGEVTRAPEAAERFREELRAEIDRRSFRVDTSTAMHKLTFAFRAAIDRPVTSHASSGNELAVMDLATLDAFDRHHSGAGLFFERAVARLDDLRSFVTRRDQTMTHFGLDLEELRSFALALNGRGVDRMVDIGEALNFGRYWDGYDLLQEFTRRVIVSSRPVR